jgi:hypothetical protein
MVRRLLVGLLATGLLLIGAPASAAQPPVTETVTAKDVVFTFMVPLPIDDCLDGPLYTITLTTNRVEHITRFDDGRFHARIAWTGTFVAVPLADPSLPTYTGTLTLTNGSYEQIGQVVTTTFTYTLHGTGSDGSTFKTHATMHLNVLPDEAVNEFFRCH